MFGSSEPVALSSSLLDEPSRASQIQSSSLCQARVPEVQCIQTQEVRADRESLLYVGMILKPPIRLLQRTDLVRGARVN